jgi:hypothetical protein
MGALCFIYAICALRTNLVLFLILFLLVPTFSLLTAGYFYTALAEASKAKACIIAGGAFAFAICMLGWYIFAAILLASVDFPLSLPGKQRTCLYHCASLILCSVRSLPHHQGCQRQEEVRRLGGLNLFRRIIFSRPCNKISEGNLTIWIPWFEMIAEVVRWRLKWL